jgi:hypothetical protein
MTIRSSQAGGWGLVEDAAGASSLMRAKKLLQDRLFTVAGITQQPQPQNTARVGLAFYMAEPLCGWPKSPSDVIEVNVSDSQDMDDLIVDFGESED